MVEAPPPDTIAVETEEAPPPLTISELLSPNAVPDAFPPEIISVAIVEAPPPDTIDVENEEAPPPPNINNISSVGNIFVLRLIQHTLIKYTNLLKSGLQLIDAYIGLLFNPTDPGYCVFLRDASARMRRLLV